MNVDMLTAGNVGFGSATIVHVRRVRIRSIIQQYMATTLHRDGALVVGRGVVAGRDSTSHTESLASAGLV